MVEWWVPAGTPSAEDSRQLRGDPPGRAHPTLPWLGFSCDCEGGRGPNEFLNMRVALGIPSFAIGGVGVA